MTNILVPELGESVVEARVARWLKKEGERVEVGEPVVELETEKIDLEVNADRGGVITSIRHTSTTGAAKTFVKFFISKLFLLRQTYTTR